MYLLDDILAAVDPPVAAWLTAQAICGPLLSSKTRLIVTHSSACLREADMVLQMHRGRARLVQPSEAQYVEEVQLLL